MTGNFQKALDFVLQAECAFARGHEGDFDYVVTENVPGDSGALTKYGIDQASHPHVDIANLTLAEAAEIYRSGEWTQLVCDQLPDGFDIAAFDIAVNNGPGEAAKLLQESANAVNEPQITVDGFVGPKTISALTAAGSAGLRRLLLKRQQLYYDIVTAHPGDAKFIHGWTNRNNALASLLNINMNAIA